VDLAGAINVLVLTPSSMDANPIHRLQFSHNKSAMVPVDVPALTFQIGTCGAKEVIVVTQLKHYINGKSLAAMGGRRRSSIPQPVSRLG